MNNYITFTCDSNYFPYSLILIESLYFNSPSTKIIGRFVNCTDEQISHLSKYKNLKVINERKKLSLVRNLKTEGGDYATEDITISNQTSVKPIRFFYSEQIAYCSNIKFDTICYALNELNVDSIIYLDVDSIVRGNLECLFDKIIKHDFAFYKDKPYTEQFENSTRLEGNDFLYHGGFIGVKNNKRTKEIAAKYRDIVLENIFDWDIDEDILPKLINENVDIYEIEKQYKDEDLDQYSVIWSGSGKTKFASNSYIEECKKYSIDFE